MKTNAKPQTVLNIQFKLKGPDAEAFLNYMNQEFIRLQSVAAQKLTLERLQEVKQRPKTQATA